MGSPELSLAIGENPRFPNSVQVILHKSYCAVAHVKKKRKNYIQGVPKKMFYVFAYISANTYSRETSRISTELAWQEASNDMRLDFLSYLVNEKINILCEILTLF